MELINREFLNLMEGIFITEMRLARMDSLIIASKK